MVEEERRLRVGHILNRPTENERRVVRLRFAFENGKPLGLRRTNRLVGLSQEGARLDHRQMPAPGCRGRIMPPQAHGRMALVVLRVGRRSPAPATSGRERARRCIPPPYGQSSLCFATPDSTMAAISASVNGSLCFQGFFASGITSCAFSGVAIDLSGCGQIGT